jgi:SAM-dependent methyltransferase
MDASATQLAGSSDEVDAYRAWKRWAEDEFGNTYEAPYYRAELAKSQLPSLAGLRVLELGFGNGGFACWAVKQGAEYVGTELDQTLVDRAMRQGLNVYNALDAKVDLHRNGPYDLIVAWDVLEHVPRSDLAGLLAECRSLLAPRGGAVVARVPSGDSPFSAAIQNGDLSHYPALGSSAIRYLAARCGFSRVEMRGAAFPILGYGAVPSVRRSIARLADCVVHPVVRLLMRSRDAVLEPNMVITLRP